MERVPLFVTGPFIGQLVKHSTCVLRKMGPLSQFKFREFLQTDFKCGG
jgi:hypothetical protein